MCIFLNLDILIYISIYIMHSPPTGEIGEITVFYPNKEHYGFSTRTVNKFYRTFPNEID